MAQYRATIDGQRGTASRLGSKSSGITTRTNGWQSGVRVDGGYVAETDSDVFDVFATAGSSGRGGERHLGRVVVVDGLPVWEPAQ